MLESCEFPLPVMKRQNKIKEPVCRRHAAHRISQIPAQANETRRETPIAETKMPHASTRCPTFLLVQNLNQLL